MRRHIRPFLSNMLGSILIIITALVVFLFVGWSRPSKDTEYGMTFSRTYAKNDLELNPDAVLASALDDLRIRRFRIPAYWNLLEPSENQWDFTDLDKDINAIAARKGTVVLAIGQKLPRWPECWTPSWLKKMTAAEQHDRTLKYLREVVTRYRSNPTIVGWQVENEPHFAYGDCSTMNVQTLRSELDLARQLDPKRPVFSTDSGELSLWATFGSAVDKLGVSVYRVVRNPRIGTWSYWFLPPYFYQRKALLLKPLGLKGIYVSEFQMEPWSNAPLLKTPIDDQLKTMDVERMKKNFTYASKMGVSPVDFWGVEWWYWMKEKQGHPEFWQTAKQFYTAQE